MHILARETAGAARTRLSLLPLLFRGAMFMQTSGASRREKAELCSIVVPANAGTHTPCPLALAVEWTPFDTADAWGYGSLRSQGRHARWSSGHQRLGGDSPDPPFRGIPYLDLSAHISILSVCMPRSIRRARNTAAT